MKQQELDMAEEERSQRDQGKGRSQFRICIQIVFSTIFSKPLYLKLWQWKVIMCSLGPCIHWESLYLVFALLVSCNCHKNTIA